MKSVAEQLKAWTLSQGMKQKDIATRLGKSVTYVSDLLNGRGRFGRSTAHEWNRAFGIREEWLMYGEGKMFSGQDDDNSVSSLSTPEKESRVSLSVSEPEASYRAHYRDIDPELDMMRKMMESMIKMQDDMRESYRDLKELYREMRKEQLAHMAEMEAYISKSLETMDALKREVLDETDEMKSQLAATSSEIIEKCQTFVVPGWINRYNIEGKSLCEE